MNRCRRCDREISDPNAVFGWRCAQILGVSETLSEMDAETFRKFVDGVTKAQKLFGKGNYSLTDEQWRRIYSAFAKKSLWSGVDEKKAKNARLEGYSALSSSKDNSKGFVDELKEYKKYIETFGLVSGISRKLAKDEKLDEVTNVALKVHDAFVGNTFTGKQVKSATGRVYDIGHNLRALKNYRYNKNVDLSSYKNGYINDQNTGAVSKLRLGSRNMDYNGCEVIAAYNAMITLGDVRDIRDVAYYFENDGQMLGGEFGTNPYSAKRYFRENGYNVEPLEGEDIIDEKIPEADAYVLSFWNDKDIMDGLHTVAVRKTKDGEYELFNYDGDEAAFAKNLKIKMMLNNNVPLVLHCISKENK